MEATDNWHGSLVKRQTDIRADGAPYTLSPASNLAAFKLWCVAVPPSASTMTAEFATAWRQRDGGNWHQKSLEGFGLLSGSNQQINGGLAQHPVVCPPHWYLNSFRIELDNDIRILQQNFLTRVVYKCSRVVPYVTNAQGEIEYRVTGMWSFLGWFSKVW